MAPVADMGLVGWHRLNHISLALSVEQDNSDSHESEVGSIPDRDIAVCLKCNRGS